MREELLSFDEEDTMKGKFLTFTLGKEHYGIAIHYVTEIVGLQTITEVPELPTCVKGIINLRGKIIPVMDARLRFKKVEKDYTDRTCTVVVDIKDISLGVIVDAVSEVLTIDEENIVPPPEFGNKGKKYINNVAKHNDLVILIIDCEKLLDEDEVNSLRQTNE